jgi:mediator of RNA polymerase II transcription subunit 8, fungi type
MAMDMDPEDGTRQLKSADWAELWDWAAPAANQIAREVLLEPEEDEEEDEEEEEEEDDDDDEQSEKEGDDTPEKPSKSPDIPMMGLEDILRFASTGATPRGIKQ